MYTRSKTPRPTSKPTVSHIIFYPVKGCAGVERYSAVVGENGIKHDREYAVVKWNEETKRFDALSQTKYPKLAVVVPRDVSESGIVLTAPDQSRLAHTLRHEGKEILIHFYGDEIKAVDQGDEASAWFSTYLGTDVRFVRIPQGLDRITQNGDRVANSIFYRTPILLISTESLADLSCKAGFSVGHQRFRSNLIISGLPHAWQEDEVEKFRIGELELETSEPCERCSIPGVDPSTGLLETAKLAAMRRARPGKSMVTNYPVKPEAYYVGTYFKPCVLGPNKSTRIYIGQEVTFQ